MASEEYAPILKELDEAGRELPDDRMRSIQDILPSWMCRQDVLDVYKKSGGRSTFVLGPAVTFARLSNVMLVLLHMIFFFLVLSTAMCTGQTASYPFWIWVTLLPFIIAQTFAELKILQFYVPAYIDLRLSAKKQVFTVFNLNVTFTIWFMYTRLLSTSNLVDGGTDSMFASTMLKTVQCPSNDFEERWSIVWEHSIFRQLGLPAINVQQVAMCVWLTSFLQMLFPLIASFRVSKSTSQYTFDGKGDNCFGEEINNESIVRQVGDASELASIGMMSLNFVKVKVEQAVHDGTFREGQIKRVISLCQQVIVSRMLLRYILENAVQINIQVTFYALSLSMAGGSWTKANMQQLLSIVLSIFMAASAVLEVKEFFSITSIVGKCKLVQSQVDGAGTDFARLLLIFRRYLWAARILSMLYVLAIVYCSCKLVALFYCKDYMWNITGCVDLSALGGGTSTELAAAQQARI